MKLIWPGLLAAVLLCFLLTGCSPKTNKITTTGSQPEPSVTGITSIEDLKGKSIGVSLGSGSDMELTGNKDYSLMRYDTAIDALLALKNDSVSGIAVEITTAREMLKNNEGLSVISGDIGYEEYGVAVAKGNDELKYKLDVFIDYLKQSGAADNLENRWIRTGADAISMPEFNLKPGNVLRVGIDATYTPFEYFGENNELLGYDIEFINKFAEFYGFQIEFYDSAFASLFTALDSNEVDLVISAIGITSDRQERYSFSEKYYENEIVFVVKTPGNKSEIKHLSDLSGNSIGVLAGTTQDRVLAGDIPGALLFYYNDGLSELKSLRARRIDAVAVTDFGAESLAQYNADLTALSEKIEFGQVAFAANAENPGLLEKIDPVLLKLAADGTLEKLHAKWFDLSAVKEIPDINLTGENGIIRFGVVPEIDPYAYVSNTQITGYDIELIRLIARELGMKVDIVELPAEGAFAALRAGKADILGGGLLTTAENMKNLRFSNPYDTAYLSLVVLHNTTSQSKGIMAAIYRSFYTNIIKEQRYMLILQGLWETIKISFLSIVAGTLFGALICAFRRSRKRGLVMFSEAYVKVFQGMPIVVLLLIVCYVFFANVSFNQTGIAVIAFGAYFAANVSEILNSGLNSVDKGQREAAIALGYTGPGAFINHIFPQAAAQALPLYRGESISLIKDTAIVGFIAVQDLTKASDIIRSRTYEALFPLFLVAIIYFLLAWAMTYGLRVLEKRLDIQTRRRSLKL